MLQPEALFSFASAVVLPGWVLLCVAPRWRHAAPFVCAVAIPGLLALLYLALIVARWGSAEGGFSSLADVAALFADPYLLLAGWVHYLAFDLFIAAPLAAKLISAGTAAAMLAEIACIGLQSLRGVPSHFNVGSRFDAGVFGVMGSMILLNSLLAAWLLVLYATLPTGLPRGCALLFALTLAQALAGRPVL